MSSQKKRKPEEEEKAEQPQKKAKTEPKKLWQVVWTEFLDDYKARGSSWFDTDTNHFASRKAAERFLFNKLHEWVIDNGKTDETDEDEEKEWRDAHKSLAAMEAYVSEHCAGEYVSCALVWSLDEVVLTKAPKANHKCDCDLVPDSEPEEEVQESKSAKAEEVSTSSTQRGA
jgi:hypothetical protein